MTHSDDPKYRREAALGQLEVIDDLMAKLAVQYGGSDTIPVLTARINTRSAAANTCATIYVGDQIAAARQDIRDALVWSRDEALPLARSAAGVVRSGLTSGGTAFLNAMKAVERAGEAAQTAADRIADHHTGL